MKDVIISIKGIQGAGSHLSDDSDAIELITSGEYTHNGTEAEISYMESEVTGMEGTRTTFRASPQMITLTREGSFNAQMVFQQGKKHVFLYETPYGAATMGIDTRHLHCGLGDTGGEMEINYTIDLDSVVVSENSFIVSVRESGAQMSKGA